MSCLVLETQRHCLLRMGLTTPAFQGGIVGIGIHLLTVLRAVAVAGLVPSTHGARSLLELRVPGEVQPQGDVLQMDVVEVAQEAFLWSQHDAASLVVLGLLREPHSSCFRPCSSLQTTNTPSAGRGERGARTWRGADGVEGMTATLRQAPSREGLDAGGRGWALGFRDGNVPSSKGQPHSSPLRPGLVGDSRARCGGAAQGALDPAQR